MASSSVSIIELPPTRRGVGRFLRMPFGLYRDDPRWVAPLLSDARKVFSRHNPFFQHARMKLWVAMRSGRDVGRIAGIVDDLHNQRHQDATAHFGFFECENDPAVAAALFDAAAVWAAGQGMRRLLGPMNPSSNDECGMLIEGFGSPPVLMMNYNPPYYPPLVEKAGLSKAKDLLAFDFPVAPEPLERLSRLSAAVQRREKDLVVRNIRRKTFAADLAKVREVYNSAWEDNWGFVPMTEAEIGFMAKRLKPLVVEDLLFLAEVGDKPVAFMMAMPDYNQALQHLRGRLLSPGLFKALPYLLGRRVPRYVRLIALGVCGEYRGRGIDAIMFERALEAGLRLGFERCELSWMLEDNEMVLRAGRVFGGKHYKTYRLYQRPV